MLVNTFFILILQHREIKKRNVLNITPGTWDHSYHIPGGSMSQIWAKSIGPIVPVIQICEISQIHSQHGHSFADDPISHQSHPTSSSSLRNPLSLDFNGTLIHSII